MASREEGGRGGVQCECMRRIQTGLTSSLGQSQGRLPVTASVLPLLLPLSAAAAAVAAVAAAAAAAVAVAVDHVWWGSQPLQQ